MMSSHAAPGESFSTSTAPWRHDYTIHDTPLVFGNSYSMLTDMTTQLLTTSWPDITDSDASVTSSYTNVSDVIFNDTFTSDLARTKAPNELFQEKRVTNLLWIYISPLLIFIGTVGNFLSILVFSQKGLRYKSTSVYFIVLAVVDSVVLYSALLRWWLRNLFGLDIRMFSDATVKLHTFIVYLSLHYSAWALVAVTFERFVSVVFPFHSQVVCTRRLAAICLSVLLVLLVGLNMHFFFTMELSTFIYNNRTYRYSLPASPSYRFFVYNVWPIIDVCVTSAIPFVIMLVCNVAIISRLQLARLRRRDRMNVQQNQAGPRITNMTAMLLTISFIFLFTTSPMAIYFLVRSLIDVLDNSRESAKLELLRTCLSLLAYTNNAINFFLYCLSGARFRKELTGLFCRQKHHVHKNMRNSVYTTNAHITVNQTNWHDEPASRHQ